MVVNAVKGLRADGKGGFRLPNFIRSGLAVEIISLEPVGSQFPQLSSRAYLFALRVPSGALQLRRAFSSDSMGMLIQPNDKALISVRTGPSGPQLTLRLAYRGTFRCDVFYTCPAFATM